MCIRDRAKGALMTSQSLTEPQAFKWIQRAAMDRRTTMKSVAQTIIETLIESPEVARKADKSK